MSARKHLPTESDAEGASIGVSCRNSPCCLCLPLPADRTMSGGGYRTARLSSVSVDCRWLLLSAFSRRIQVFAADRWCGCAVGEAALPVLCLRLPFRGAARFSGTTPLQKPFPSRIRRRRVRERCVRCGKSRC